MNRISTKRLLFSFAFFLVFAFPSFAAHIIGSDITVLRTSANNYQVTVTFFRDCSGGGAGFENPMYVFVYDKVTNAKIQEINMGGPTVTTLTKGDACYVPSLCVEKGIYVGNAVIANNPNGYYLSWMRCCRNNAITNIVLPGSEGSIFYAEIPDPAIVNSTPVFNTVPQSTNGYMCATYTNYVDFSATDPDGDQLKYFLSAPLSCNPTGQCSSGANSPQVTGATGLQGPYLPITWGAGFSTTDPFGVGTTTLSPTSGLLTVVPPSLGVYVLCIRVEEWRSGVKIGEIRRDFQFEVLTCQRLNINISPTSTVCIGQVATLTGTGALAGWTYSWNPGGATGATVTGMSMVNGITTYTATASNGVNCIMNTGSFLTNSPTPAVATTGNVCLGQNTTLTASGGGTYSWNNGTTSAALTGVANGNYTVTVTNSNACTNNATGVVYQAPVLTSTVSVTNVACSGSPATATVTATNGSPGYTYAWTSTAQTTSAATGLGNGNYSVTVTDTKGCTSVKTFTVAITSAPSVSATSTPGGCTILNGTATANPSGGGGAPFTYLWDNGQTAQTATGLTAGNTYSITITDSKGCTKTNSVTVSVTSNPTISSVSSTNSGCTVANGTATANGAGGTGAYTFIWAIGQTAQTATGLAAGNYSVTIQDANGCTNTTTVSVAATNAPAIASATSTIAGCSVSNGTATVNPSGGTGTYTYNWLPGGQNSQTATGLAGGNYTITVSDANNCTAVATVSVSVTAAPTVSATATQATCGNNNGAATANPSGGTPGYSYSWTGTGQTTQTVTGLVAGLYTVTITDASGCTTNGTANVSNANGPTATTSVNGNVSCFGGANGSATANPSAGTPGYTYLWNNGQTTQTATGLTAGNHNVTITDANGCLVVVSAAISQPSVLTASTAQTAILCNGATANVSVSSGGGTPAYSYSWSSGQTTSAINGVTAGNYTVTVSDANGCAKTNTLSITQPALLTSSIAQTAILCNGGTANASVNAGGGTPGYIYNWSSGQTTSSVTLGNGSYTVTITDANGCKNTNTLSLTQPAPLILSGSCNDSICSGDSALLSVSANGGTPNYTYLWLPGPLSGQSISVNPTSSTIYFVTTTDANGCVSAAQTCSVTVLPAPTAQFDTLSNGMFGATYSFNDLSNGGSSWFWMFGDGSTSTQQNPVHTFPGAGTYTVTQVVFSQNGCPDTFKIMIGYNDGILIPNVFSPDGDGTNDVWFIPNSGMKEFHVDIYDRWGLKVFETTADEIRWDGRSTSGILLSDGTYYFVLKAILRSFSGDKDFSKNGYVTLLTQKRK
jgi:gliding motility-associated-like protein